MPTFSTLFSPVSIGSMQLPNRVVMAPMTTDYGNEDQTPSERLQAYLLERARGGVGLITVEVCTVDPVHRYLQHSLCLGDDRFVESHRAMVQSLHDAGAKVQPQITHTGPESLSSFFDGGSALGPSPVVQPVWGGACRALELDEIPVIIEQFGRAARRAQQAGYDGIELHAAHAYNLLGSFLSPWRNKRTDSYGGNKLATRARLLLEVIESCKQHTSADFPITVRLSGYERAPGGRDIDDTQQLASMLVNTGVDALHISGGVSDRLVSQIVEGSHTEFGYNVAAAQAIRNVVNIPVLVAGRIHTPELAEQILREGAADLVVLGRPLLADAEWANKAKRGVASSIRRCISCENCIDSMARGTLNCAVNARMGRELDFPLLPAEKIKHVLVVGGGPGGMEAARVLALRGHRVTLAEQQPVLGGSLVLASTVHTDNNYFLDYLRGEMHHLPINICTGTTVDIEYVKKLQPDAVVVANGAQVLTGDIVGSDLPHVYSGTFLRKLLAGNITAYDVRQWPWYQRVLLRIASRLMPYMAYPAVLDSLSRIWLPVGKRVVIVGADLVAVELAEFLAERGRMVTLLDSGTRLAPEVGRKRRAEHMDRLDKYRVVINTGVQVVSISKEGVKIRVAGHEQIIVCDHVIVAGEVAVHMSLADSLKAVVTEVHAIGDCTGLGLIVKAVADAVQVASKI